VWEQEKSWEHQTVDFRLFFSSFHLLTSSLKMLRQTFRIAATSKVSPSIVAQNRIRLINGWLGARVNVCLG
jgi:hypothetical protein